MIYRVEGQINTNVIEGVTLFAITKTIQPRNNWRVCPLTGLLEPNFFLWIQKKHIKTTATLIKILYWWLPSMCCTSMALIGTRTCQNHGQVVFDPVSLESPGPHLSPLTSHLSSQAARLPRTEPGPGRASACCPTRPTAPWWRPTPAPHSATTAEWHWTPPGTHNANTNVTVDFIILIYIYIYVFWVGHFDMIWISFSLRKCIRSSVSLVDGKLLCLTFDSSFSHVTISYG